MNPRFIVYVSPIGACGPDVYEFTNFEVAHKAFEESCSPLLNVEVWHLYVGPNPMFPSKRMQTIQNYWHMGQEVRN